MKLEVGNTQLGGGSRKVGKLEGSKVGQLQSSKLEVGSLN